MQKALSDMEISEDVDVLFDMNLEFVKLNRIACEVLNVQEKDVLCKSILKLYPEIINSEIHENLKSALKGELISTEYTTRSGREFYVRYRPVYLNGYVAGVHVKAQSKTSL